MGITESRELLLDWYEKARTQVTGRITDLSSAVSLVASILAGFCIADYKLFYGVPMHKLVRAKPSHLVTHRIMHSPVERLQTILGLRRYAPPESLVRDIVRMRGQEEDMTSAYLACIAELQSHTADLETANGLSDIVTWVNDCASFWRQVYMSEIVPGLQDTLQHADDCRITLEEIREMTQQRREYLALVELSDVE
ncbi:hypothetical protein BC832DRAFT_387687 [Gaertneriomyces semiglobifer]|nr:hypothetical protein BC832DRAFT_387687 [Gaertneriomyces semiglobifer]